eukprot:CAMPEP_0206024742 /NCGR_PEP_ID=MMETSP1464-20131121/38743_1 /ASSEMBLY_ACC=CAM_ASM_001124 /TAXON_ID=119497 /ORGANISM="Exanthemachrysis gayraliae, Strain RCC1523" /LENGTH=85 /DNA_ID=CAMNT_0053398761 /DNA_START=111 /DNA_END=364 /DNA_ORIENTATION=-
MAPTLADHRAHCRAAALSVRPVCRLGPQRKGGPEAAARGRQCAVSSCGVDIWDWQWVCAVARAGPPPNLGWSAGVCGRPEALDAR